MKIIKKNIIIKCIMNENNNWIIVKKKLKKIKTPKKLFDVIIIKLLKLIEH